MDPEKLAYFTMIAKRALQAYHLEHAKLTFIQHSDTLTFHVEAQETSDYLLRIHVPATPAFGEHGTNPEMIRSELLWIEALHRSTDLVLQYPVRNQAENLVTVIDTERGPVNCSLLTWLDGELYSRDVENADTVAQMGIVAGKIHLHSSRWRQPAGFIRPQRDAEYFDAALARLFIATNDGRIEYADYRAFETSIGILKNLMAAQRKSRQTYGLLHGDLHRGNMLIHHGQIRLIDFSFCSIGFFAYDLAVCISNMRRDLQDLFLVNYQRFIHLPKGYERFIEGLYIGSMASTFAIWLDDPDSQETIIRRVPVIAREYAGRFNQDERFWLKQPDR